MGLTFTKLFAKLGYKKESPPWCRAFSFTARVLPTTALLLIAELGEELGERETHGAAPSLSLLACSLLRLSFAARSLTTSARRPCDRTTALGSRWCVRGPALHLTTQAAHW